MNFSPEWESQYQAGDHMSTWPWSDLVSHVYRYTHPRNGFNCILELGCGAGANIPFFKALGVDYHAIDGSSTIVRMLHERFPEYSAKILEGDFTKQLPFDAVFDLVVDRSSLISNTTVAMLDGLKLAASKTRNGGYFIGIDWFSTEHDGFVEGKQVDSYTRDQFPETSDLAGIGTIHFCDEDHLTSMLNEAGFELVMLEHKQTKTHFPKSAGKRAWWNFVAVKL